MLAWAFRQLRRSTTGRCCVTRPPCCLPAARWTGCWSSWPCGLSTARRKGRSVPTWKVRGFGRGLPWPGCAPPWTAVSGRAVSVTVGRADVGAAAASRCGPGRRPRRPGLGVGGGLGVAGRPGCGVAVGVDGGAAAGDRGGDGGVVVGVAGRAGGSGGGGGGRCFCRAGAGVGGGGGPGGGAGRGVRVRAAAGAGLVGDAPRPGAAARVGT